EPGGGVGGPRVGGGADDGRLSSAVGAGGVAPAAGVGRGADEGVDVVAAARRVVEEVAHQRRAILCGHGQVAQGVAPAAGVGVVAGGHHGVGAGRVVDRPGAELRVDRVGVDGARRGPVVDGAADVDVAGVLHGGREVQHDGQVARPVDGGSGRADV